MYCDCDKTEIGGKWFLIPTYDVSENSKGEFLDSDDMSDDLTELFDDCEPAAEVEEVFQARSQ